MSEKINDINNITLPVYKRLKKETREEIASAIQADKDIVSQIQEQYDETADVTTFTFPKGVLPIRCYHENNDEYIYFDYINGTLLHENGNPIEETYINTTEDGMQVTFEYPGERDVEGVFNELMYINIDGVIDITNSYNWFKILNPQQVKPIYCHPISLAQGTDSSENIVFRLSCMIFNNSPTPFTLSSFKTFLDNLYYEIGGTVRINMSGVYKNGQNIKHVSWLAKTTAGYSVVGISPNEVGTAFVTAFNDEDFYDLFPNSLTLSDGVNIIN